MKTVFRWLQALILLPINVTVVIPLILFEFDPSRSSNLEKGVSLFIGLLGSLLSLGSVRLFAIKGEVELLLLGTLLIN